MPKISWIVVAVYTNLCLHDVQGHHEFYRWYWYTNCKPWDTILKFTPRRANPLAKFGFLTAVLGISLLFCNRFTTRLFNASSKIDPSGIEPHTSIIRLINPVIRKFVVKDKCFASYVCNLFLGNNKPAKQLLISQLIVVRQFILLGCITDSNTRKVMKSIRLDRLYDNWSS